MFRSKLSFVALVVAGIFCLSGIVFASRSGDTIRVHCDGCNLSTQLNHLNSLLEPANVRLVDADQGSADVTVSVIPDSQMPAARPGYAVAGAANPLTGHIDLASSTVDAEYGYVAILHEILHCAGIGHEPNDSTSLMHNHAHTYGQLYPRHIKGLRRLSGITPIERLAAAVSLLIY